MDLEILLEFMNEKAKEYFPKFKNFEKEELLSLKSFVDNIYLGDTISKEESIKNVQENLIEILYRNGTNSYRATGLRITNLGHFITARHCLEGEIDRFSIITNNRNYQLEKKCVLGNVKNPFCDVILGKLENFSNSSSIIYKIKSSKDLKLNSPLMYLGKKGGKINKKYGQLLFSRNLDIISTTINIEYGDSGGVILGQNGEISSILYGRGLDLCHNSLSVDVNRIIEMIYHYINHMNNGKKKII